LCLHRHDHMHCISLHMSIALANLKVQLLTHVTALNCMLVAHVVVFTTCNCVLAVYHACNDTYHCMTAFPVVALLHALADPLLHSVCIHDTRKRQNLACECSA
jgi:hypothetical protein